MLVVSDEDFSRIISKSLDELPAQYVTGLKNVLITYENEPTLQQREKQKLLPFQTLFGLYEGVPLTKRDAGYQFVLPDRITIFKLPIAQASADIDQLKAMVKHTLWHEIAHYYGLDHARIQEIEDNWIKSE